MRDIGHFIGGRHVAGSTGRHGDVFDPGTGAALRVGGGPRGLRGLSGGDGGVDLGGRRERDARA